MSVREVMVMLKACDIYSKTLFGVIYDCGLRSFEACNLKWNDINFDRHCPKCQNKEREVWIEMRKEEVMPGVKYFHVVFIIPDSLHPDSHVVIKGCSTPACSVSHGTPCGSSMRVMGCKGE